MHQGTLGEYQERISRGRARPQAERTAGASPLEFLLMKGRHVFKNLFQFMP